jgi:hypothetical protein
MKVKVSSKKTTEIIVSENYKNYQEFDNDSMHLLYDNLSDESVFVSFIEWNECTSQINLVHSILVTHFVVDIEYFAETQFNELGDSEECSFNVYEFESYQDAFDFCKLLKEGV